MLAEMFEEFVPDMSALLRRRFLVLDGNCNP
jgi:hypothetical protein